LKENQKCQRIFPSTRPQSYETSRAGKKRRKTANQKDIVTNREETSQLRNNGLEKKVEQEGENAKRIERLGAWVASSSFQRANACQNTILILVDLREEVNEQEMNRERERERERRRRRKPPL
jgi:hypothetical protein